MTTEQRVAHRLDGDDYPIYSGVCGGCVHLRVARKTCGAFPDGIPDPIWRGDNRHTEPFPGDRGIRYEGGPAPWIVAAHAAKAKA